MEGWNERVALGLLGLATAGSALAIGAVHPASLAGVAVLSSVALALVLRARSARDALPRVPLLARIWTGLAAFTALQTVPLPMGVLARLAPGNADVWQRALLPFGAAPSTWAPVSLDPGSSRVEALRLLVYATVCVVAANLRADASTILGFVVASAAAVALATLGHGLVGARTVFGIYEPNFGVTDWHVGPLLNSNTLAGYLNLGALTAIGLLASTRSPSKRVAFGLAAATMMAVNVRAGSRGGLVALALGCAVLAVSAWRIGRRRTASGPEAKLALGAVVLVALLAGVFLFLGGTRHALSELRLSALDKLAMVRWVVPMIQAHAWLGIGRGSFESVFEAWRPEHEGNTVYTHAENFPAQWISEWGVLAGGLGLVWFLVALRPRTLGAHRSVRGAGVFAGVCALVAQNLVDLGLEIPAIPIALSAAVGALNAREWSRGPERSPGLSVFVPRALLATLPLLVAVALLARSSAPIAEERRNLKARFDALPREDESGRVALREELRAAMLRRPAEGYFSLLGAILAFEAGDESPMPWLGRALERSPLSGRAHLLTAMVLTRLGARGQALIELELAARYDGELVGPVARLALRLGRSDQELLTTLPPGAVGVALLERLVVELAARRELGDGELVLELDLEAIGRDPGAVAALTRVGDALIVAIETDPATPLPRLQCPDGICLDQVAGVARALERAAPGSSASSQLLARLDLVLGKAGDALARLERDCLRAAADAGCHGLQLLVAERLLGGAVLRGAPQPLGSAAGGPLGRAPRPSDAQGAGSPSARFDLAVRAYLGSQCADPVRCADAHTVVGDARARVGQPAKAVYHYGRAANDDPREARWRVLAEAAERAGLAGPAMEARRHLAGSGSARPDEP